MTEFVVRVPDPHSPEGMFITGDSSELGRWHPRGVMMHAVGHGIFSALVDTSPTSPVRFNFTRGHWRAVERAADGGELFPRKMIAEPGSRLEFSVAGWGRQSIHYHPHFYSYRSRRERSLNVYLPPGYELEPHRRYPVVYMHDGQNLFDAHTAFAHNPWRCDEIAEQVIRSGECEPVLIVGIANSTDRIREYGPRSGSDDLSGDYARTLVDEVKPFIDAHYRTKPGAEHTAVGGASMGGLISLYLSKWYPGVFGMCIAMSPSVWWERESFIGTMRESPEWLNTCRVWLDIGGREGGSYEGMTATLERTRRLGALMRSAMPQRAGNFRYVEDPDGRHNESDWGRRFADALRWMFPR